MVWTYARTAKRKFRQVQNSATIAEQSLTINARAAEPIFHAAVCSAPNADKSSDGIFEPQKYKERLKALAAASAFLFI